MSRNTDDKRVYLSIPTLRDVKGYIRHLWADEETMRDVGGIHVMDDDRAVRWYSAWVDPGSDDSRYFLIVRREGGVPVAEACFHSYDETTGIAKCSMNVEAKYRGNGYAREALELILRFYFCKFGGRVMVDDIAPDNRRAQQVFMKFGFELDPSVGQTVTSMGGDDVFWVRMDKERFEAIYAR